MIQRIAFSAVALALVFATAGGSPVLAQRPANFDAPTDPSRGDALSNPAFKGPEVLKLIGLRRGQRIADLFPGRFTTAFARAVGPRGKVYGVMPSEIIRIHPEITGQIAAHAKDRAFANVEFSTPAVNAMVLPDNLDAVFIRQNYHDLHVRFMGPADVPAFNRKVFAALKPGGVFVILDHAAQPGSGLVAAERLHRIDPAIVKAEMAAAGFVFDGESKVLANPADARDKMVLDSAVLGKTDQFLLRFRKPRR